MTSCTIAAVSERPQFVFRKARTPRALRVQRRLEPDPAKNSTYPLAAVWTGWPEVKGFQANERAAVFATVPLVESDPGNLFDDIPNNQGGENDEANVVRDRIARKVVSHESDEGKQRCRDEKFKMPKTSPHVAGCSVWRSE